MHNTQALCAARSIAKMASNVYDPDPWKNHEARQAYQDALNALRRFGIISDYNIQEGTVTAGDDE